MIKFIYFDVGGVVIKDFSASNKWKEWQGDLGVKPENEEKFHQLWMEYRSKICLDYDIEKLIPLMNAKVGLSIPSDYSLLQGFVSKFERNESIWPLIEKVKVNTRIGLLTNMYVHMLDSIIAKGLLPKVTWDTIVDSSIVKMQKPDSALFAFAEKAAQIDGKDILFIDNQEKHVHAAKQYGWQAYLYDSADYTRSSRELGDFFKHVGVL